MIYTTEGLYNLRTKSVIYVVNVYEYTVYGVLKNVYVYCVWTSSHVLFCVKNVIYGVYFW